MAQLLVRKLDAQIVRKLRQKAAADGISAEEEHRRILRKALLGEDQLERNRKFNELLLNMPSIDDLDLDSDRREWKFRDVDL